MFRFLPQWIITDWTAEFEQGFDPVKTILTNLIEYGWITDKNQKTSCDKYSFFNGLTYDTCGYLQVAKYFFQALVKCQNSGMTNSSQW